MKATIILLLSFLSLGQLWCSESPPAFLYKSLPLENISDNSDASQRPALIARLRAKLSPTLPNLDQLLPRTPVASSTTPSSSIQQH